MGVHWGRRAGIVRHQRTPAAPGGQLRAPGPTKNRTTEDSIWGSVAVYGPWGRRGAAQMAD
eukprot:878464-Pyramimonas_sp.AAC.1